MEPLCACVKNPLKSKSIITRVDAAVVGPVIFLNLDIDEVVCSKLPSYLLQFCVMVGSEHKFNTFYNSM